MREAFTPSNINKYNKVLNNQAGTPMIFFFPMLTKDGNCFRKPHETLNSINFLEKWLIAEAFRKNTRLINMQNTKYLKNLHVTGIFNSQHGEATKSSTELGPAIW